MRYFRWCFCVCFKFTNVQSRNGSRELLGVVPRLPFRSDDGTDGGSTDGFRGVLMPDGVELPLKFRLSDTKTKIKCIRN